MSLIACSDTQCQYNLNGQCTAGSIDLTSDRFCSTGRRRPVNEIPDLMRTFNSNCYATKSGYKVRHGDVLK
jgi:hypothetical protein